MADTKNESPITPALQALASKIEAEMKVNAEGVIEADAKLFQKVLPEGLTVDDVKKVQAFGKEFFNAAAVAVGTVGQAALKKNKKLESVSIDKLAYGTDHIDLAYHRAFETTSGFGADATKVTKHGWLTGKYVTKVGSNSASTFAKTRAHFAEQGASLFGK